MTYSLAINNGRKRWYGRPARTLIACIAVMLGVGEPITVRGQVPCRYDVSAIIQGPVCQFTGPTGAFGTGISPNGRYVCGYYPVCSGEAEWRAFLFDTQTNQFTTLPLPQGGFTMKAWDVNDTPWVVGDMNGFAYVLDFNTGEYVAQIPPLVSGTLVLNAINSQGVACGTRAIQTGPTRVNAFTWSPKDGPTDLGLINGLNTTGVDLNEEGRVTGTMVANGVTTPFVWYDGQFESLGTLANLNSSPQAINDAMTIVGSSQVPNPNPPPSAYSHAFLWDEGVMVDLGLLPGYQRSVANDISGSGMIVGFCRLDSVPDRAVVWYEREIFDLTPMTTLPAGSFLEQASGISQGGIIIVGGRYLGQSATFVLMPSDVPPIGDVTHDCRVGMDDLLLVINEWGLSNSPADIDQDRVVNINDLMIVLQTWTY